MAIIYQQIFFLPFCAKMRFVPLYGTKSVHVYSTGNLPVNTQNQYFDFKFYFYSGFLTGKRQCFRKYLKFIIVDCLHFSVQNLNQLCVLVSSAHKTTRRNINCIVLKVKKNP